MDKKPKIAVIGLKGLPAFGGAAAVGENIIEQLKDQYDFTVYSVASHTNLKTGEYNGYMQIVLKSFFIKKLNVIYYYFLSSLLVLIKKYDLVHVHHTDVAIILPILRLRHKVVITSHGSAFKIKDIDFKYSKFATSVLIKSEEYFLRFANIVTCVSKELSKQLSFRHKREVYFIPNGVENMSDKVSVETNSSPYLLFAAGRIIPTKGCHIFLQALHNIEYKGKIIIVGDIDQHMNYKSKILQLSEGLDVDFLGLIKNKTKLLSLISNASLFIFPSSLEAMSMMLLEAASVKTPIISSNIIENSDIFSPDEVLFHEVDDSKDLALKIKWAIDNKEKMQVKADKAFLKLITNYNWKAISKEYSMLFQKLIES